MEFTTYKWMSEHMNDMFASQKTKSWCIVSEQTEVHYGNNNDCDLEYCKQNNIPVYNIDRCGGTIVCSPGTIGVALITNVDGGWQCEKMLKTFSEYLRNKGIDCVVSNNDILIDGFKVVASMEWRVCDDLSKIYSAILLSYDVDIEAIRHICKKEMVKIPKGLKDFGLTQDELVLWCKNYFENLENEE
jgi:lipoate-protein ligase A